MTIFRFKPLAMLLLLTSCGNNGYANDDAYDTDIGRIAGVDGPEYQAALQRVLEGKFARSPKLAEMELINSGFQRYADDGGCSIFSRVDEARALIRTPFHYDRWVGVRVCPAGITSNVAYKGL